MPIGTEVESKVAFSNSEVPLPPGRWQLAAAGEYTNKTGAAAPLEIYASLVQIVDGRLVGVVWINGTYQAERIVAGRDPTCNRTDYLLSYTDKNINRKDQWCLMVLHETRSWIRTDKSPPRTGALYVSPIIKDVVKPRTLASMIAFRAYQNEFIKIVYEIDPTAFGGPAATKSDWSESEWYVQNIDRNPAHRAYADKWISWSRAMFDVVLAGFNSRLSNYVPAPLPKM
ncbi:MAG: hypothetical protein GC202_09905 [Alphaproteobacteria bacterium]|nr:hypothetical protein [Alphaproteobacteria bacterium]